MFEFTDKTKKKIKVINVTEARGNFAAILSDNESHYIITKNNKPQRVIIGFEDFKRLQGEVAADLAESSAQEAATPDAGGPRKPRLSPSVRGMIAAQIELSQQNEKPAPEIPADFSLENVEAAPRKLDENDFNDFQDASSGADETDLDTEENAQQPVISAPAQETAVLPEPQDFEDGAGGDGDGDYFDSGAGEDDFALNPKVPAPTVEESVIDANREALIQDDGIVPSPAVAKASPESEAPVARTPEEEAYYRRYRKLYEGYPPTFSEIERKIPTIAAPEAKPPRVFQEPFFQPAPSAPVNDPEPAAPPPVVSKPSEPRGFDDSFAMSLVSEDERRLLGMEPPEDSALAKGDDGLPSLQELLRDLDKQRLTGEEPHPLDARDIDDIINRITSD